MSLFRRPGDDTSSTSSSDESSDSGLTGPEETSNVSTDGFSNLSRVNTISSGTPRSGRETPLSSRPGLSRNPSHVRDLLLHSLLEEKALREAAEHLGKDQSDPEVQELARTTYLALSRQLPGPNDERYTSDSMRSHRAAIQEGIGNATRRQLLALAGSNEGSNSALIARTASGRSLSALNLSHIFAPLPLQGYPGLHTDRYVREFIELQVVGKGGYGTVYKVKHKLDNSLYAVKRIVVSPARLQKIQKNGPQEMEHMLEEVRALARFDHGNIVRYHNCWLEFTTAPLGPLQTTSLLRNDMLLEHPTGLDETSGLGNVLENMSLGDNSNDAGIVFEYSDADGTMGADDTGADNSVADNSLAMPTLRKRSASQSSQASHVTVKSVSSARSKMSTIESADNSEEEEVENIPRYNPQLDATTTEVSDSMLSNSEAPNQLIPGRITGPVLTLNVQMSLYDTSLAEFLSIEQSPTSPQQLRHCFHPCISMELLSNIISGVEYLHAQGVVHRDLKPANVFLSISTSKKPPSGSIDLSTCRNCHERDHIHLTPRIGDFGLVAALGEGCFTSPETPTKPVGTEFYRPEGGTGRVSEKLDVYALGIVCFEMLEQFSTRMERVHALTNLRRGEFPEDFARRASEEVQDLISMMLTPDEDKRPDCEDVQHHLGKIIGKLRETQ